MTTPPPTTREGWRALIDGIIEPVLTITDPDAVSPALDTALGRIADDLHGSSNATCAAYSALVRWAFDTHACGCGNCERPIVHITVIEAASGTVEPIDDTPPLVRAVSRYLAACVAGDVDQVYAIWDTVMATADPDHIKPFLTQLCVMVVKTAERRLSGVSS